MRVHHNVVVLNLYVITTAAYFTCIIETKTWSATNISDTQNKIYESTTKCGIFIVSK